MSDFIEILVDVFEALVIVGFVLVLMKPKVNDKSKLYLRVIISVFCFAGLTALMNIIDWIIGVETIINIVRTYLMIEFLCSGNNYKKLSLAMISEEVADLSALATAVTVPIIMKASIVETYSQNGSVIRIVSLIFFQLTCILLYFIIGLFLKKTVNEIDNTAIWKLACVLLGITMIPGDTLSLFFRTQSDEDNNLFFLVLTISIFASSAVSFYVFVEMIKKETREKQLYLFLSDVKLEAKRIEADEEKEKKARKIKHEVRNEYILIRELIRNDNLADAVKYLDRIIHDSEKEFTSITEYDTGVRSVNAITNYFYRRFVSEGIETTIELDRLNIFEESESVICSVMINLLKNALEAENKEDDKKIKLSIKQNRSYIYLVVSNKISKSVLSNNPGLLTDKKDKENHGFGISSVRESVKKVNGSYRYREKEGFFVSEVMIWGGKTI